VITLKKLIFMRRSLLLLPLAIAALVVPAEALAVAPTLIAVGQQNRHVTAGFSAPRADFATIYVASKPDRATDGNFLQENVKSEDVLTASEIQSGQWLNHEQVDPGTYWVMLEADPAEGCYLVDAAYGVYLDPACADGFSNIVQLVVPEPAIHYSAAATVYRYLDEVDLQLTATPLGADRDYRLCYRLKTGHTRCLAGTLHGVLWNTSTDDTQTISKRNLPRVTTFNWYVGGKRVATKRVLIRR
jgi:hypothetical protein